jgi:chromosome segregation ATPase
MKILNDSQFNALKKKADDFDKIVNAMIASSEGVDAAEITSDVIIEALNSTNQNSKTSEEQAEAMRSQVSTLTDSNKTLASEKETLSEELERANTRIQELEKEIDSTPAEEPAEISSTGDSSEEQDIIKFAEKNAGNPIAVLSEMKKQGFKIK